MDAKSRILVIDDDEVVRSSYRRSLASTRCDVDVAWNGFEALRAMQQKHFDVVLLDLRMPGMDGMTVLKTIKEKWPASEVVIITGFATLETAKEAVRLGAYGYLTKPVGPDDVIDAARGAMSQKMFTLHRDVPDQADGAGASAGSRGRAGNHVF